MAEWTPERVEQLRRLWAEGWSASEIMREMGAGLTRNMVLGKVHRLKLERRRERVQPARKPVVPRKGPPTAKGKGNAAGHHVARMRERRAKAKPAMLPKPFVRLEPPAIPVARGGVEASAWAPLPWATPVALEHVTGCWWPATDPFVPRGTPSLFCDCEPAKVWTATGWKTLGYCGHHQARAYRRSSEETEAA